jgi:hypothetical protein
VAKFLFSRVSDDSPEEDVILITLKPSNLPIM